MEVNAELKACVDNIVFAEKENLQTLKNILKNMGHRIFDLEKRIKELEIKEQERYNKEDLDFSTKLYKID